MFGTETVIPCPAAEAHSEAVPPQSRQILHHPPRLIHQAHITRTGVQSRGCREAVHLYTHAHVENRVAIEQPPRRTMSPIKNDEKPGRLTIQRCQEFDLGIVICLD